MIKKGKRTCLLCICLEVRRIRKKNRLKKKGKKEEEENAYL